MSASEYRVGPRGEAQLVVDHSADPLTPTPIVSAS